MEVYRGAVTHNRLQPTQHAFAYEVFSVCVDIDVSARGQCTIFPCAAAARYTPPPRLPALQKLPAVSRQFWPFVSFDAVGCAVFRTSDHLHNHRKPGQSLSDAVRDFVHDRTGWRPRGTIKLLTNLAYWGYNFNPVSFYFVYGDPPAGEGGSSRSASSTAPPDRVEAIIAEVTNTPWGEQHCYVLHRSQAGVEMAEYDRATRSWLDMKHERADGTAAPAPQQLNAAATDALATAMKPVVVESAAHAAALAGAGAAGVTDYGALAAAFDAPIGGSGSKSPSAAPAPGSAESTALAAGPRRIRCRWDKSFHVSPFMSIDHAYDWIFTEPAETLLIQSQNRIANKPSVAPAATDSVPAAPVTNTSSQPAPGTRMFNTQLRLTRLEDVTRWTWFYLLFIAFPFLTLRIQWWIHYEAFRLWWKGVPIYAHPGGTSNGFTRAVAAIMWPFFALAALFQTVDAGGAGGGDGGAVSKKAV